MKQRALIALLLVPVASAHGITDGDSFPPDTVLELDVGAEGSDVWLHMEDPLPAVAVLAFNHRVHDDRGLVRFRVSAGDWNHTWDHEPPDHGATELIVAPSAGEYRVQAWSLDGEASRWATVQVATPCVCQEVQVDPVLFPATVLFDPEGRRLRDPPVADTAFYTFTHEWLCIRASTWESDHVCSDGKKLLAVRPLSFDANPRWMDDYEMWYPQSLAQLQAVDAEAPAPMPMTGILIFFLAVLTVRRRP